MRFLKLVLILVLIGLVGGKVAIAWILFLSPIIILGLLACGMRHDDIYIRRFRR